MSKSLLADIASHYNSLPKMLYNTTCLIDKQRDCADEYAHQLEIDFLIKFIRGEDPNAKFTDESFRTRFFRWCNQNPDKSQRPGKRVEWRAISALTKYTYGGCKFAMTDDFYHCTLDIIKAIRKEINHLDFNKLDFHLDLSNCGEALAFYLKLKPEDSVAKLIENLACSSIAYDYTAKSPIFKSLRHNLNANRYEDRALSDLILKHSHKSQKRVSYVSNSIIKKFLLDQIDNVIQQWDALNITMSNLEDHQKDLFCEIHHIRGLETLFIGLPNIEQNKNLMHTKANISYARIKQLVELNHLYLHEKRSTCLPSTLADIYSQVSVKDQHIPIRLTPEGENLYWVRKCISYAEHLLTFKASHFITSGGWVFANKEGKDSGGPILYLLEESTLDLK